MLRGPAAKGHPWPSAAIPASMPGCPLRNAYVRPAWFNGAPRSRSRSKAKQSKAKQEPDTSSIYVTEPPLSRASSLPHGFAVFTISGDAQKPVGAGLLAKASAQPTSSQTNTPLSRASPLPHGVAGNHSICTQHKKTVGASLLAMASAQPTSQQTDPPLSRASPLPQEERVHAKARPAIRPPRGCF